MFPSKTCNSEQGSVPQLSHSLLHQIPCTGDGEISALPMEKEHRGGKLGSAFVPWNSAGPCSSSNTHNRALQLSLLRPHPHRATHAATPTPPRYHSAPQITISTEVVRFFLFNTINRIKSCFHALFPLLQKQEEFFYFF